MKSIKMNVKKLKKIKCLNQYKTKIKRESYIDILQRKQTRTLFKLRIRIINVGNNFKNKYEDLISQRCKKEIDDEKYLFTKCEKLADIQNKYDINDPSEMLK